MMNSMWKCKKWEGTPDEEPAIPEPDGAGDPEGDPILESQASGTCQWTKNVSMA